MSSGISIDRGCLFSQPHIAGKVLFGQAVINPRCVQSKWMFFFHFFHLVKEIII